MPKTVLTALVAATILAGGSPVDRAAATPAAASAHGIADAKFIREAAIVCGGSGCNPVQTKSQKRRKFNPLGRG